MMTLTLTLTTTRSGVPQCLDHRYHRDRRGWKVVAVRGLADDIQLGACQ